MKIKKIILIVLSVLIVTCLGLIIYSFKKEDKPIKENKVLETIEDFGYSLEDRDYHLYKTEYEILKKNLNSGNINNEEYAKSIAKLFIIDLYTLNNKLNKYDVGGSEFVLDEVAENYKLKVEDTLYKLIIDNSYNDRKEVYPIVSKIEIDTIEDTKYTYNDIKYDAYKIKLNWEYEKDANDYDSSGVVIVIEKNSKIYVVEKLNK